MNKATAYLLTKVTRRNGQWHVERRDWFDHDWGQSYSGVTSPSLWRAWRLVGEVQRRSQAGESYEGLPGSWPSR